MYVLKLLWKIVINPILHGYFCSSLTLLRDQNHIGYIVGKVTRGIRMTTKARKYLLKTLFTLSFIYITYYNHIWGATNILFALTCGATYISNLGKLIRLQNSVLWIMSNVLRLGYVTSLYWLLGIFIIYSIAIDKYLIGRFMFRFCNNWGLVLFYLFFAYHYQFYAWNIRSAQHFLFLLFRLTWVKLETEALYGMKL